MNKRNCGIDLLKIFSMFSIVLLHVLLRSGSLEYSEQEKDLYFFIVWILEIIAYSAVDIFALITGYLCYKKDFKITNMLYIWISLLFYSYLILLIYYFFVSKNISNDLALNCIFPVLRGYWWYISAYIGVQFLSPYLNTAIKMLNKRELICYAFLLLIPFSCLNILRNGGSFNCEYGYSVIWLLILYIIGGTIEKTNILEKISIKISLILLLTGIFCTYLLKSFGIDKLIGYTSPVMVINSICFLVIFSKIKIRNKKIVKVIEVVSGVNLDVYLIHIHPVLWGGIWGSLIEIFNKNNTSNKICYLFLFPFLIYITCLFCAFFKDLLFHLCKVGKFCSYLNEKFFLCIKKRGGDV